MVLFILLRVNSYWQYLATGIILILALSLGLLGMGGKLWTMQSARGSGGKIHRAKTQ